MIAGGTELPV